MALQSNVIFINTGTVSPQQKNCTPKKILKKWLIKRLEGITQEKNVTNVSRRKGMFCRRNVLKNLQSALNIIAE